MARLGAQQGYGLWQIAAASHVGRVRSHNEDRYAVLDSRTLSGAFDFALIVADGMGGRNAGEVASAIAVEAVSQTLLGVAHHVEVETLLHRAVENAHMAIQRRAEEHKELGGMGTTLVVALARGQKLWIAHVGDSRAYLLCGERLLRLTEDHTFVAEQVRAGAMSVEQARQSRFRNMLTRAVGTNADYTPEITSTPLQPGDVLMVCSDGLTNMLSEEEIAGLLHRHALQPEKACNHLITLANANGGQDNITVVLAVDQRRTPTALDEEEELHTVEELPTVREPVWHRATKLLQFVTVRHAVIVATALVLLITAFWGISALRKPEPRLELPVPPPVVDLASVRYENPQVLLDKPLRGSPLVIDAQGRLYAMSEQGRVLCISSEGKLLMAASQPFAATVDPALKPDMVYFATDAQSNLYVCYRPQKRILKYRPDGTLLGTIGEGKLTRPAALAVGADGSVYVIDAGKLTVFRALPEVTKDATQSNR